jgi:hypothetical protein
VSLSSGGDVRQELDALMKRPHGLVLLVDETGSAPRPPRLRMPNNVDDFMPNNSESDNGATKDWALAAAPLLRGRHRSIYRSCQLLEGAQEPELAGPSTLLSMMGAICAVARDDPHVGDARLKQLERWPRSYAGRYSEKYPKPISFSLSVKLHPTGILSQCACWEHSRAI